jgi:hypothetical protein
MATEPATLEVQVCVGETTPTLDIQTIVATNISPHIFVFKQTLERDDAGCYIVEFCSVASCQQMTELPEVNFEAGISAVRRDSVSFTFKDYAELQEALDKICKDIDYLLECWNKQIMFTENKFIITFPKT